MGEAEKPKMNRNPKTLEELNGQKPSGVVLSVTKTWKRSKKLFTTVKSNQRFAGVWVLRNKSLQEEK